MDRQFEEVEHTADIAIRVWGRSLADLFANAAYGMACQMVGRPAGTGAPNGIVERTIELTAYDAETLLVTWLSELLYLGEREGCIFTAFDMLDVSESRLRAVAWGEPALDQRRHIKAVTFSDLEIVRTGDGYETVIVFDV